MQRLNALFRNDVELHALTKKAVQFSGLQKIWDEIVPPALRPFSRAGSLKHRRITVFADNGAIAAKLKLLAPNLLKNLQIKGVEVTSIRVEVQVNSRHKGPPLSPRALSGKASTSLTKLAEQLPESPLKQALQRLASRRPL